MKSLILKDLFTLRSSFKSMILSIAIISLIFGKENPTQSIYMATIMFSMMLLSSFSFDDYAHWSRYAAVLPVTRHTVVKAKFVLMILLNLCGSFLGLAFSLLSSLMFHTPLDAMLYALALIVAPSIATLIGSMMLPLIYKFGVEKGRIFFILVYLIPFVCILILAYLSKTIGIVWKPSIVKMTLWILPLILMGIIYLMYRWCCHIYDHTDIQ